MAMRHPVSSEKEVVSGRDCQLEATVPREEENVSLVRLEALPDGSSAPDPNQHQSEDDEKLLATSHYHEEILNQAGGQGPFQRLALLMCGLGLSSDAIELYAISYVLPSAEQELCLEERQKGWLGIASLVGMMAGGLAWGPLGDSQGRRRALLSALSINAVFGVVAAFMPTFHLFLTMRLCSGIGIGGSLPVVFTYFSEFLVRKRRGHHLSLLLTFWATGGIFVALLAWIIVPTTGPVLMNSKGLHFGRWRLFLLACSLPATLAAIGISFLPESPRFLMEMGRTNEALYVYRKIFATNNTRKSGLEYQLTSMELPYQCPVRPVLNPSNQEFFVKTRRAINTFLEAYVQMLTPPNTRLTVLLLGTWSTLSFGFYGMSVYFPEHVNQLRTEEFKLKAINERNLVIRDTVFNSTLQNTHFSNSVFINVQFVQMVISHSSFYNCSFWNCTFSDIRTSRSAFTLCDFDQTVFIDTDLHDYKFISCTFNSSNFFSPRGGCDLDFDINLNPLRLFSENAFAQLSIFIGTLTSSFLLDTFGRVRILAMSLLLSGASICFVWLVRQKETVIVCEMIFSFVSICGWNALDVLSAEAYPAKIRTTSYGFVCSASRLAGILGNVVLSNGVSCLPIITAAVVLLTGAICAFQLPETKDYLL